MNFSAIIDKNYISRLKALIQSLSIYCKKFNFYVISLDNETYDTFLDKKNCIPIKIRDIHEYYPELDVIQKERDRVSYIFSLSPFYPSYLLENYPHLNHICTLDADQFFFSSPKPIFELLQTYSVLITPHRFSKKLVELKYTRFGKNNVSFQVFKRDEIGFSCLSLWRKQCIEWCYDREENDLYADQKYLDFWEETFGDKVHVIQDIGLGLAPWNIENYKISKRFGNIFVDNNKLILFHYQGLRFLKNKITYTYLNNYIENIDINLYKVIYKKIIKCIYKQNVVVDFISRNSFDEKFIFENQKYCFIKKFFFYKLENYNNIKFFHFLRKILKLFK